MNEMTAKCAAPMPPKQLSDLITDSNRIAESIEGQLTAVMNQLFGEELQCGEVTQDVRCLYDAAELLNKKLNLITGKFDALLARL